MKWPSIYRWGKASGMMSWWGICIALSLVSFGESCLVCFGISSALSLVGQLWVLSNFESCLLWNLVSFESCRSALSLVELWVLSALESCQLWVLSNFESALSLVENFASCLFWNFVSFKSCLSCLLLLLLNDCFWGEFGVLSEKESWELFEFFFYMSYGSCPPIGSDEEDVVELARDLLSCFCNFLNFWNFKNCWNSSSESESSWIVVGVLWVGFGVTGEFIFLGTCWIWYWSLLPVAMNSVTVMSEHSVWLNLSHHLILNSLKRLIGNLSAIL